MRKILLASAGLLLIAPMLQANNCQMPTYPMNLNPSWGTDWETKFCDDKKHCTVEWKGYKWWVNFHANKSGFYNGGMKQSFDPRNVYVSDGALVLRIFKSNLAEAGKPPVYTAAEAVLVSENAGNGRYLLTIKFPMPVEKMDPNLVVGVFTYKKAGKVTGNSNPHNELDLIEISKWGQHAGEPCTFAKNSGMHYFACNGGIAQWGTQPWEQRAKENTMERFGFPTGMSGVDTITLYMDWKGPGMPVEYKMFKGSVTMATATAQPGDIKSWTLPASAEKYVPNANDGCTRLHVNFYMQRSTNNVANPPNGAATIRLINFEYQKTS